MPEVSERLVPFNFAITPAQRRRWQSAADALSARLGVKVSLSSYIRRTVDKAAISESRPERKRRR